MSYCVCVSFLLPITLFSSFPFTPLPPSLPHSSLTHPSLLLPPSLPPPSPPSSLPPSLPPSSPRKAMEKMQNVYKENPKLGDPNSLGQSLEQTSQKIAALIEERDKFQVRKCTTGCSERRTACLNQQEPSLFTPEIRCTCVLYSELVTLVLVKTLLILNTNSLSPCMLH